MNYLDRADERYEELRDEGLLPHHSSRKHFIPTPTKKKTLRVEEGTDKNLTDNELANNT